MSNNFLCILAGLKNLQVTAYNITRILKIPDLPSPSNTKENVVAHIFSSKFACDDLFEILDIRDTHIYIISLTHNTFIHVIRGCHESDIYRMCHPKQKSLVTLNVHYNCSRNISSRGALYFSTYYALFLCKYVFENYVPLCFFIGYY